METAKFLETVVETVMETVGKGLETVFFIFKKRKGRGILFFNIIRIPWFPTLSQQFPQRFPQRFPRLRLVSTGLRLVPSGRLMALRCYACYHLDA